ncbi:Uncharacterized protein PBTT_08592 [Plasmodiophora brassicae]
MSHALMRARATNMGHGILSSSVVRGRHADEVRRLLVNRVRSVFVDWSRGRDNVLPLSWREDVDHIVDDVLRFTIVRTPSPPSYPSSSSSASDDSLPPAHRHSQ